MTELERLQKELERTQQRIREEKRIKAELKIIEDQKQKERPPLKLGRPKLKPELIEEARELAKTKNLSDVALKLDISLRSLYKYGISRNALNRERAENKLTDLWKVKNENDAEKREDK